MIIQIFTLHVHKKKLNEKKKKKKCLRIFNKKTPLYAGLGSEQKTFNNCQATYQNELWLLFENPAIFFTKQTPSAQNVLLE